MSQDHHTGERTLFSLAKARSNGEYVIIISRLSWGIQISGKEKLGKGLMESEDN